jgi:hypothetical protein
MTSFADNDPGQTSMPTAMKTAEKNIAGPLFLERFAVISFARLLERYCRANRHASGGHISSSIHSFCCF